MSTNDDTRPAIAGLIMAGMLASMVNDDGMFVALKDWGERDMYTANAEEAVKWADALLVALSKTEGKTE